MKNTEEKKETVGKIFFFLDGKKCFQGVGKERERNKSLC